MWVLPSLLSYHTQSYFTQYQTFTHLINPQKVMTELATDKIFFFVAGAHVCQPEHRRMCVGSSSGGPCQEDGRQPVVGAVRSKHRQVGRDDGIQYSQFRIQLNATLDQQTQGWVFNVNVQSPAWEENNPAEHSAVISLSDWENSCPSQVTQKRNLNYSKSNTLIRRCWAGGYIHPPIL